MYVNVLNYFVLFFLLRGIYNYVYIYSLSILLVYVCLFFKGIVFIFFWCYICNINVLYVFYFSMIYFDRGKEKYIIC